MEGNAERRGQKTAVIRVGKAGNLGSDLRALGSSGGLSAREGHSSQLRAGMSLWWVVWRKDGSRMGGQRSERCQAVVQVGEDEAKLGLGWGLGEEGMAGDIFKMSDYQLLVGEGRR